MKVLLSLICSLALGAISTTAFSADPTKSEDRVIEDAKRTDTLPPSQSDDDPAPPVPAMQPVPEGGIVEQAGRGGVTSYARAGVIELGGSASLNAATDYLRLSVAPSIGYFIIDNIELSALIGLSYLSVSGTTNDGVKESATQTIFTFLIEPSVHIPFTETLFGFLGLGMGLSYADQVGTGFALQPRLGLNVMVGRSGILSPALFVQYSTHSAIETSSGTLLAVSLGYGFNLGYTVMW